MACHGQFPDTPSLGRRVFCSCIRDDGTFGITMRLAYIDRHIGRKINVIHLFP
jgi:hypothetical protein